MEKEIDLLSDGQGGTVFAVENGKGSFVLTNHIDFKTRRRGDISKRKAQKQARKKQRRNK